MVGNSHRHLSAAVFLAVCCLPLTAAGASSSSSNGQIAFVRDGDIYTIQPDGSNEELLISSEEDNGHPAWSPDGRTLAFDRDARITILQADGSQTSIPTCDFDFAPSWSPDGQRLAVFNRYGKIGRLVIQSPGGGGRSVVYNGLGGDPEWSPDGSRFVFTEAYILNDVRYGSIWSVGADGSNAHALTDEENVDTDPSWSPDGTRVVFVSGRDGNSEIYSMAADGSDHIRLTNDPAQDGDPAWSPDGTKIAFVSDRGGSKDVYVMDADGTAVAQVTTVAGGDESSPNWQPVPESPGEGPTIAPRAKDCEIERNRVINLHLRGSLVASGRVKAPGYATCAQGDVRIERRKQREWKRMRDARGNAYRGVPYRIELPDRPGRYRARVDEIRYSYYVDRRVHICPEVVSEVVVRRD